MKNLMTKMMILMMKTKRKWTQVQILKKPREKFTALRNAYELANKVIEEKGRGHAEAQAAIDALAEVFKEFRLVPKVFDRLVKNMRAVMDRLRVQERLIMKHCVVGAGMPKATFIKIFPGNETSLDWFEEQKAAGHSYSARLNDIDLEVERLCKN